MQRLVHRALAGRLGRAAAGVVLGATLGTLGGACGVANDASSAITGPLLALKDSDAVVENNLQSVLTTIEAGESPSLAGIATTSGPSTGYGLVSVSSGPPAVLAGFNQLSDDCLGLVYIATGASPVLGASQAGTYYFWITRTSSAACDAASFAATPSVPAGWPPGDPSGTGWPLG
jgi:hypothetical protein